MWLDPVISLWASVSPFVKWRKFMCVNSWILAITPWNMCSQPHFIYMDEKTDAHRVSITCSGLLRPSKESSPGIWALQSGRLWSCALNHAPLLCTAGGWSQSSRVRSTSGWNNCKKMRPWELFWLFSSLTVLFCFCFFSFAFIVTAERQYYHLYWKIFVLFLSRKIIWVLS